MIKHPTLSHPLDSPGPRRPGFPACIFQCSPLQGLQAISIIRLQNPSQELVDTREAVIHVH